MQKMPFARKTNPWISSEWAPELMRWLLEYRQRSPWTRYTQTHPAQLDYFSNRFLRYTILLFSTGHQIHGRRGEGNGCYPEKHEPWEGEWKKEGHLHLGLKYFEVFSVQWFDGNIAFWLFRYLLWWRSLNDSLKLWMYRRLRWRTQWAAQQHWPHHRWILTHSRTTMCICWNLLWCKQSYLTVLTPFCDLGSSRCIDDGNGRWDWVRSL